MGIWIVLAIQVVLSIATFVAVLFALAWTRAGAKDGHEARRLVEALLSAFRRTHECPDPPAAAPVTRGTAAGREAPVVARSAAPLVRATYTGGTIVIVVTGTGRERPPDRGPGTGVDAGEGRVIIPPPPSGRLLPPHLDGNRTLPGDPRGYYPLARRALNRYRGMFAEHERDDLCQEIVIAATLRAHAYDPARGTVEQWIAGIARNCVRRYLRDGADELLSLDAGARMESVPAPEDAGVRDRREALLHGLRLLTRAQRTIVTRHLVDGRTFREIAAETGVPFKTVHARYTAAEARLRRILRKNEK